MMLYVIRSGKSAFPDPTHRYLQTKEEIVLQELFDDIVYRVDTGLIQTGAGGRIKGTSDMI